MSALLCALWISISPAGRALELAQPAAVSVPCVRRVRRRRRRLRAGAALWRVRRRGAVVLESIHALLHGGYDTTLGTINSGVDSINAWFLRGTGPTIACCSG